MPLFRGIDAGGRFLDLSGRCSRLISSRQRYERLRPRIRSSRLLSIEWSPSPDGPFQRLWEYDSRVKWKDAHSHDRTLLWPEVDRHAKVSGARQVYVRYRIRDMAIDNFRMAVESEPPAVRLR